jgi:hypothetical protein
MGLWAIKTNVYVDGYNLYYGAVKYTRYKWLDLNALCVRLLPSTHAINQIRYFTAAVKYDSLDPKQKQRQDLYLRALRTLPNLSIFLGRYLEGTTRMRLASPPLNGPSTVAVIKREEKGSDVNLASYLLLDAFNDDFQQAIVVSNDSDLATPIWMVKKHFNKRIGIWNPHTQATNDRKFQRFAREPGAQGEPVKRSVHLKKVSHFQIDISSDGALNDVAVCQFADTLTDSRGSFSRPAHWA